MCSWINIIVNYIPMFTLISGGNGFISTTSVVFIKCEMVVYVKTKSMMNWMECYYYIAAL